MEKNKKNNRPTRTQFTVFKQICELIPPHLVPKLSRKHGVDKVSRGISEWSHVVALMMVQLAHSLSLNDICDHLRLYKTKLSRIRGATPPSRNGLSNASKIRSSAMAQDLFWQTLNHLETRSPSFGRKHRFKGMPRRFRRAIHAVDSTTIQLVAKCMDWAKHRRRKAAAKCHVRLDLQSFLPRFVIIDTAKIADSKKVWELCAPVKSGEIVLFDKAYVDFCFLNDLSGRGVFWVTRAKDNMSYRVVKKRIRKPQGAILRDDEIVLKSTKSRSAYPQRLRRVEAEVEVDGKKVVMVFITNNLDWAPQSVADLYQARWAIEVFFKQMKQTLQLSDFLGTSANAVEWQVWSALLVYLLLRYQAFLSNWNHSFSRLSTMIRAALWLDQDLLELLCRCGTAKGGFHMIGQPHQAYLPGFS